MDNQRQSARIPFEGPVEQFMLCGPGYPTRCQEDEFVDARSLDLSAGGIGCESSRLLEPLTHVFIMFAVSFASGDRMIRAEGYVAHARREGDRTIFGVRFHDLTAEERAAIEAYICSKSPS